MNGRVARLIRRVVRDAPGGAKRVIYKQYKRAWKNVPWHRRDEARQRLERMIVEEHQE